VSVNVLWSITEYSLLPMAHAERREPTGELSFRAGSPAIHVFSLDFLDRVTKTAAGSLPYRAAFKAVSHFDPAAGQHAPAPKEPNAIKFERFIFDALPHAERWLAVETPRAEEFAPIKNASGPDSPETAKTAQVALHTGWLKSVGIDPQGHPVEISPLFALDPDELAEKILSQTVPPGTMITGPKVFK
jgi:UDP-N-acetylglucosamine/UDP-N-acetylgalactosamine diphosphorylase